MSVTVAALQRIKMPDGTYAVVLPINTTDEVYVNIEENKNLTGELSDIKVSITTNLDSVVNDLLTLTSQLSSFLQKPLNFNHVRIEDFTSQSSVVLTSGGFTPGILFV